MTILEWSNFKILIGQPGLQLISYDCTENYYLFLKHSSGHILFQCRLIKNSSNATDFEENYDTFLL